MKRDIYVLIGIAALVLSAMIGGAWLYQREQRTERQDLIVGQAARLESKDSPTLGAAEASVKITEFLDPECESCRAMHPRVKEILADYEGRVRYQIRYMPLHGNSFYAASLLEAAREQGKYWEALDILFERQPEWGDHHAPRPELVLQFLGEIGLDVARLEQDAKKPEITERIERDRADGQALGVRATPTFFVNDRVLERLDESELRAMIDVALNPKP